MIPEEGQRLNPPSPPVAACQALDHLEPSVLEEQRQDREMRNGEKCLMTDLAEILCPHDAMV